MTKSRLEAFSDGVLAIIITVMVLTLDPPLTDDVTTLIQCLPKLLAYVLSFSYVAIYWNNHHHLTLSLRHVTSGILWTNMIWLFFLSLIPWSTSWIGRFYHSRLPVMFYGCVLFGTACAYFALQHQVIKASPAKKALEASIGKDIKGKVSLGLYLLAIIVSYYYPMLANSCYVLVALMWVIPDKRIAQALTSLDHH